MSSSKEQQAPGYPIGFIEPSQNFSELDRKIAREQQHHPITLVIDLTKGNMSSKLLLISEKIPCWNGFSMSRVRQATKIELPTSGHIISHNPEEIRAELQDQNLNHILVLDDTSFSGSTNLIIENLVKTAFPDRDISFTHGFLILNTGDLGPNPGALQRLTRTGVTAVGGHEMFTPKDDGWHFFDLVKQDDLENHLLAVSELLELLTQPQFEELATGFLSDENMVALLFPSIFTTQELEQKRSVGHFVGNSKLSGEFHVRNPQLLPNIIGQGHLLPQEEWQGTKQQVFNLLLQLEALLEKE